MNRRPWLLAFSALSMISCTKTCVGIPELGSKTTPLRFFIAKQGRVDTESLSSVARCTEATSGFRVQFEATADEKSVGAALGRGEAHLGFMSSLGYVAAASRFEVSTLLVRVERGLPSTRAVIIGKSSLWQSHLAPHGLSLTPASLSSPAAQELLNQGRFLFLSPDDDIGFFVPRFMLLEKNIFPAEAAFAGSWALVLQGIERELAVAGAVSEPFLLEKYEADGPLRPGMSVGPFVVIDASRTMPGRVVVARSSLSRKIRDAVAEAFTECSRGQEAPAFRSVFGGEGFDTATDRAFAFVRELFEQQETYLRVLVPAD